MQDQIRENEVNLRNYIDVLLKRKRLIISIFLISTIATAIVSLRIPKAYQAFTQIMVIPSSLQQALKPTQLSLNIGKTGKGGSGDNRSTLSLETHKSLLLSSLVLTQMLERVKLSEETSMASLRSKLSVKEIKGTSLLELRVKDKEPKRAKNIADIWADEYFKYNRQLLSGEVKGSGEFIMNQFKLVQEELEAQEDKIEAFLKKNNLDLMEQELEIKKTKFFNYRYELSGLELNIKTHEDNLKEFKAQIKTQDRYILVSKAITDEALWKETLEKGPEKKDLEELDRFKLQSQELNPIFQGLEEKIVNTQIDLNTLKSKQKYLKSESNILRREIIELRNEIKGKDMELVRLNRELKIKKGTYNGLTSKVNEIMISKAAELGEVRIVSPAIIPEIPIPPKRRQRVVISGIVSLMFGVFLAFFVEFWQASKPTQEQ